MAVRKDGVESFNKLLKVASEVFAEKGYHNTTVAEICRQAGSNVAAVNYHFGSKDGLYATVWKNAFEEAMRVYPPDGRLPAEAKPEERLHALIYSVLHRVMDDGRLGQAGQILLKEMSNPTEVILQFHHDVIRPLRERTRQIIKELLGPKATEQQMNFCELSLIHQCLALGFRKSRGKVPPFLGKDKLTGELIDALVDHITLFSLAGIREIRRQIESRELANEDVTKKLNGKQQSKDEVPT
jgi:AcrR family transcriptional regulator